MTSNTRSSSGFHYLVVPSVLVLSFRAKWLQSVTVVLLVIGCLTLPAWGQPQNLSPPIAGARGIADEWNHHRLIFSEPASPRALRELREEPRYLMQQMSRKRRRLTSAAEVLDAKALQMVHSWGHPLKSNKRALKADWSENVGPGARVGAGMYGQVFVLDQQCKLQ